MHRSRSPSLHLASFCLISIISTQAAALYRDDFLSNLYLGADLQARHMSFKSDFGHNLFRNHFTQGNFYGGFMFNCFSAIEFGYEEGRTRHRQTTLTAGEISAGVVIPEDLAPATFRNSSRVAGYHLDLVGYFSQCETDPLKFITSFGFAYAKGTFIRTTKQLAELPMETGRVYTRRRLVARVMAGLQYKFLENFSARGTLTWENTKGLKSISNDSASFFINQVRPEDSVIASLGLVWHF